MCFFKDNNMFFVLGSSEGVPPRCIYIMYNVYYAVAKEECALRNRLDVLTRPDRGVVYVHRSPVSHGEVFADGSRATDRTPRKIFFGEFEISTVYRLVQSSMPTFLGTLCGLTTVDDVLFLFHFPGDFGNV